MRDFSNSRMLSFTSALRIKNHFMSDILNKTIVLVLNRNWQAINIRTPADAFCQMATNVATALEIDGENHIRPVARPLDSPRGFWDVAPNHEHWI